MAASWKQFVPEQAPQSNTRKRIQLQKNHLSIFGSTEDKQYKSQYTAGAITDASLTDLLLYIKGPVWRI